MRALLTFVTAVAFACANAQQPKSVQASPKASVSMDRFEGTALTTQLGYGITLNKGSAMKREWFVVRDDASPVTIDGGTGISVMYKSGDRGIGSEYQYKIPYRIIPKEPITAFELRAIVIDVFGRLVRTLSATEVTDFNDPRAFEGIWRIWSENEASEAYASVVYIAQVRTATGRVYESDRTAVFDQVRRVTRRLTEADLEPKREVQPR